MTRIDAHQHFWRLSRGDYRWLTPELAPLYRDFEPRDLAPLLARAGIERTLLVQAADTLAESHFLLALANEHEFIAGVVGWVDLPAADAIAQLEKLAREPKFVGVRPMLQDLDDDDWILRRELEPALRALVQGNLVLDALIRPRHLPRVRELAARHPDLRVVVDHAAKPRIESPPQAWDGFEAWQSELRALARESSACVKLSGLATEARGPWSSADLRPYVELLLEAFGPARLIWGSDWPVVELAGGYGRWMTSTNELLCQLSEPERAAIFGGNAARTYRLLPRLSASGSPAAPTTHAERLV